jgi:hypothetical protein
MSLLQVQKPTYRPQEQTESGFMQLANTVLTGLNIANQAFGLKANYDKINLLAEQAKQAPLEQQRIADQTKFQQDLASKQFNLQEQKFGLEKQQMESQAALAQAQIPMQQNIMKQQQAESSLKQQKLQAEIAQTSAETDLKKLDKEIKQNSIANVQSDPIKNKLANLNASSKDQINKGVMGLKAVRSMREALNEGENTFSLIGDNKFTIALRNWEEAIGRLQSGGAISEDEGKRFRGMAPTKWDSAEIQKQKLNTMADEMLSRIQMIGSLDKNEVLQLVGPGVQGTEAQSLASQNAPVKFPAASIQGQGTPSSAQISLPQGMAVQDLVNQYRQRNPNISEQQAIMILRQRGAI